MATILNEIYIGSVESPILYFSNANIISVSGEYAVDLVGDELSVDRLTPVVKYEYHPLRIYKPLDYDAYMVAGEVFSDYAPEFLATYNNVNPAKVPYGTELWYYTDGELAGKFYVEYIRRVARDKWEINAVSVIGLLDNQYHRGGVYNGKAFAEVLTEFFGGTVGTSSNGITPITGGMVNCYVEDAVAETTVNGMLQYDTKRNNLHQLIFAYVVNMIKDSDGDLLFFYLKNSEPVNIPPNRIYMSGEVVYEAPITDVELTEYTYVFDENVEPEEVYDNVTAPHISGEALVVFKQPIKPESIETSEPSMIVRDANEVSAYVTGNGVITAKPYQVQSRVISRSRDDYAIRKTVSVDGVTLVNPLNSTNIMDRLFDFYTKRQVVRNSIIVADEKPGKLYGFTDPYNEPSSGFLHRMSFNTTSLVKADCELITNFTPAGLSTNMNNAVLLTGEGTWKVPSSVRQRKDPRIRVTLIGGGQGGHCGYCGGDSERNPEYPGEGGLGGEGGSGGKVWVEEIGVKDIESFTYSCGLGGEGGEPYADSKVTESETGEDLGAGQYGTDTTFGDLSTEYGAVAPGGIMNLLNGKFYARTGATGIAGAKGGKGAKSTSAYPSNDELAKYSYEGESVTVKDETWEGGKGAKTLFASQNGFSGWAYASGGSGAAYGARGNDGQVGHVQWQAVIGGHGPEGATSPIPGNNAQYVGCGGDGGHGGGGGGAPGDSGYSRGNADPGYIGKGGKGSKGGKGAPGGILIYY